MRVRSTTGIKARRALLPALLITALAPAAAPSAAVAATQLDASAAPAARPAPVPAHVIATVPGDDAPGVWDYTAVDAASGRLLVARMTGVQTIALADNKPAPMLAAGQHVHSVVPLPGHRVLFTNGDANTATIVSDKDGRVLATVATGNKPDGAIYDAALHQVLVMNGKDGTVSRIDVGSATPKVVGTITVGGALEAPALGDHGRLFINIENQNQIAAVSLTTGQVTGHYALDGCKAPSGLAFSARHKLLVSACANGVAKVLSEDGDEVATLEIGPHPDAAFGDPAHDRVFIPSGGDGTLAEISLAGTPHVTRVFSTHAGARTGAYDPRTERVYLPYGDAIRTKGQPPKLVPGSFGVLVADVH